MDERFTINDILSASGKARFTKYHAPAIPISLAPKAAKTTERLNKYGTPAIRLATSAITASPDALLLAPGKICSTGFPSVITILEPR